MRKNILRRLLAVGISALILLSGTIPAGAAAQDSSSASSDTISKVNSGTVTKYGSYEFSGSGINDNRQFAFYSFSISFHFGGSIFFLRDVLLPPLLREKIRKIIRKIIIQKLLTT